MELTQRRVGERVELHISGRLDAYWAEHLDAQLADLLRSGAHTLDLQMAEVRFLSSAGIRVLLSYAKQLAGLNGSLRVVEPSAQVREVLELSGLAQMLSAPPQPAGVPEPAGVAEVVTEHVRLRIEGPAKPTQAILLGDPTRLDGAQFTRADCAGLTVGPTTVAIGIGALGNGWDDCHDRFGEFLAAAGVAVCLPGGSEAAPDFMVGAGDYVPSVETLYAISCELSTPLLVSFEPSEPGAEVPLSRLLAALLEASGDDACAAVILAETSGLVGASLKLSPTAGVRGAPFEHPLVREWLSFTSEPAHGGALAVVAGFADWRPESPFGCALRPLGRDTALQGHFHAATLSYRALPRRLEDPREVIGTLFETQSLDGLLHLLPDLRGVSGVGESVFTRGVAWVAPVAAEIAEGGRA